MIPFVRITFENIDTTATPDAAGQVNDGVDGNWKLRGSRVGGVEETAVGEKAEGQVTAGTTYKVVILADVLTNSVTPQWRMRFTYGGRERKVLVSGVRMAEGVPRKLEITGIEWLSR